MMTYKEEIINVIIDDEFDIFANYFDEKDIDWSIDKNEIYHTCILYYRKNYIDLMEKKGVLNKYAFPKETALVSLMAGEIDIFNDLVKSSEIDCQYLLKLACKTGFVEAVKYLVDNNLVDPEKNYKAAYRYAAKYGHIDVCKELSKNKSFRLDSDNEVIVDSVSFLESKIKKKVKDKPIS